MSEFDEFWKCVPGDQHLAPIQIAKLSWDAGATALADVVGVQLQKLAVEIAEAPPWSVAAKIAAAAVSIRATATTLRMEAPEPTAPGDEAVNDQLHGALKTARHRLTSTDFDDFTSVETQFYNLRMIVGHALDAIEMLAKRYEIHRHHTSSHDELPSDDTSRPIRDRKAE